MKNDIWKLLVINKNDAAEAIGKPALTIQQLDWHIDQIEMVSNGFAELTNSNNYNLEQLRCEMRTCARIHSELIFNRTRLVEILETNPKAASNGN